MDIDTAVTVLHTLDEAERILGEMRLRCGIGIGSDVIARNRELLDEARHQLDVAHQMG